MPVYTCPECSTKLKRAEPLPAGKKLRCPECAFVFAPAAKADAAASNPTTKKSGDDAPAFEQEKEIFGFQQTDFNPDVDQAREDVFRPIQDRFERSLRGPALIQVVRPSDWLLRTGSGICISAVVGILWAIWPLIFKIEVVQPVDKNKFQSYAQQGDRRFKELTDDEFKERWIYLACFVAFFLWGAVVCVGASKMHTLESYPLAIVGSIMALLGPGVPWGIILLIDAIKESDAYMMFISGLLIAIPGVPMCLWCLATLRRQDVIDGFREEKPEVYVGDKVIQGDL
jgi:hypothetical protein